MKREEYNERMKDNKYRELTVTKKEDKKDYVFISYRGDSWKKVLTEIVYKLQKKYGLRVYFDKDFASETNSWIQQFEDNMDSQYCKACLCFFDEGYVTSYATLLELMHAMNARSNISDAIFPIYFPIDWEKLNKYDGNTGLGVEDLNNPGWKDEIERFNQEFKMLKKRYEAIEDYYYHGVPLRECDCMNIMGKLQPKNKRVYEDNEAFYDQFIVAPLKKKCPGVFEDVVDTVEPKENSLDDKCESATKDGNSNGTTKEIVNIVSDGSIFRIKGRNDSYDAFYCTDGTNYTVLRGSKVKYNEKWITKEIQEKCKGRITKDGYLLCDIEGLKISTAAKLIEGTSTNGKELNDEKKLLENGKCCTVTFGSVCNLDAEIEQRNKTVDIYSEDRPAFELEGNEQNEKKDWTGKQLHNDENSAFEFELWGVLHSSGSMAGMMHDVFDLIAEKYPNRISDMADDDSITSVARKDDVDSGKLPPSKMNYFNTKKEHSVNGTLYYVSTRYNREQGIGQLKKMLTLCEGSSEEFRITSAPKKSTHNVNKSVKKTLVEAINE